MAGSFGNANLAWDRSLSEDIPGPGGDPWDWYNVYTYINIAGDEAAYMHGGCYTDPATGQIISVDYFGNPSGMETEEGGQQIPYGMSGGCYQDPMSGEIICVDMEGELGGSVRSAAGVLHRRIDWRGNLHRWTVVRGKASSFPNCSFLPMARPDNTPEESLYISGNSCP